MAKEDLQKVTLNLMPGDYDKLRELFPEVGAGPIIRKIVHNFIAKVEQERTTPLREEVKI